MNKITIKRARHYGIVAVLSFSLIISSFASMTPSFGATASSKTVVFDNVGEGENAISLTENRSFVIKVKVDMTKSKLESAIKKKTIKWNLSRKKGMQDSSLFPYQFLGGSLASWRTVKSSVQKEMPLFSNIKNTVISENGKTYLKLSFDCKTLFGRDGVDERDCALTRNTILDYTGKFNLECLNGKTKLGSTSVWVRPYDSFNTQSQLDASLASLAARANAAGIYAKVESIGKSVNGKSINALFISAKASDLTDHLALTEKAETNPTELKGKLDAGTLKYKVPVIYSNIHSDEIICADGCIDFADALITSAEKDINIPYKKIEGLTAIGQQTMEQEMKANGNVWSATLGNKVKGIGYIRQGGKPIDPKDPLLDAASAVNHSEEDMNKYYNIKDTDLDVEKTLDDMFFIIIPSENPDGRSTLTRTNANYFDLNRDNSYQTQPETQAMTRLISKWNPISLYEMHGYYNSFVVEPCTPPHEPNAEYDLYIDTAAMQGENFGATVIANNDTIDSFQLTIRDNLKIDDKGKKEWSVWEDVSPSYTPIYAFLHGCNAYTAEFPYGSAYSVEAVKYGCIGNAAFISEYKDRMYSNQLEFFRRGLENIDAESIRPYYVSQDDTLGAEADIFRKKYEENNNFFPEYYIIPIDTANQKNIQAARDMAKYLIRNDVKLKQLTADVTIKDVTYKKGSIVVDMHQAKRNMANSALYSNLVISTWNALYSEPLTAFPQLRGFDVDVITKVGAIKDEETTLVSSLPTIATSITGTGSYTVLSNESVDAVKAVNQLLKAGKRVGMITSGTDKGDFVVYTKDFGTVSKKYVLVAKATTKLPTAKIIKKSAKVYVPGKVSTFSTLNGQKYGVKNYDNILNYDLGWDLFTLEKQLGFQLTSNAKSADIIVGGMSPSKSEIMLIKAGKPYVGYTANGIDAAKKAGVNLKYKLSGDYFDALSYITYEDSSLITAKYKRQQDDIMYGYGGNYITQVPTGATVLIKTSDKDPIEGFMTPEYINSYKNQIQAIDYKRGKYNMTLFANTMTNKSHQLDEYRYITNAIYSKMLGERFKAMKK